MFLIIYLKNIFIYSKLFRKNIKYINKVLLGLLNIYLKIKLLEI